MTESQVEKVLGAPDRALDGWAKERPECRLISWDYYFEIERGIANSNNKLISISFDRTGHLYHVWPINLPELKEKGSLRRPTK
jgi:hypothetical protein